MYFIHIGKIFYFITLVTSLNVTNKDNVINNAKPSICIDTSSSCFIGFFRIPSIINKRILPPSNGGKNKRFVTPNDNDIKAIIYIYS